MTKALEREALAMIDASRLPLRDGRDSALAVGDLR